MSYVIVAEEGLATSRSGVPAIDFATIDDNHPVVRMTYTSSKLRDGVPFESVTLTFSRVLVMNWVEFDTGFLQCNDEDTEFTLIEITNSALLANIVARNPVAPGELDWLREARHYRIAFDDHGTYDIVCYELQIDFKPE
jgi:hypothetical protein